MAWTTETPNSTEYTQTAGMDGDVGADNVTELTAQAAASAASAAADLVLTNADAAATGADAIATAADVVLTAADVVTTGSDAATTTQDAIDTAADVVLTNADVVTTNADAAATGADATATAADRVVTTQDAIDTAADAVLTAADVVSTAADLVATAQDVIDAAASAAAADDAVADAIGVTVQAYAAVLDGTTASYTTAEETKVAGMEAAADVTDTTNVTAAGAVMDSELTAIASVKALDQGVATTDSPTFVGLTATGAFTSPGIDDNATSTAITIDSSENVGIGVTSTPQGASTSTAGFWFDVANGYIVAASGGDVALLLNRTVSTGAIAQFRSNGSVVGSISVTGSATAYNTSSDYRLKDNITPIQGAADIVKMMRPCTYTFKADGSWADGFIAHEMQELHPQAVTGSKDAMQDEEYEVSPAVIDDEGAVVTEAVTGTRSVPDYQGVDYSKLTPILTAALQEALTKIDDLETRLAALEA